MGNICTNDSFLTNSEAVSFSQWCPNTMQWSLYSCAHAMFANSSTCDWYTWQHVSYLHMFSEKKNGVWGTNHKFLKELIFTMAKKSRIICFFSHKYYQKHTYTHFICIYGKLYTILCKNNTIQVPYIIATSIK